VGITENFDAKAIADYEAYYHQKDAVAIRMAKSGTGRAMLSTEVVRESEFLDSEIFVDFAKPMRLGYQLRIMYIMLKSELLDRTRIQSCGI
jgi:hypothetical protein